MPIHSDGSRKDLHFEFQNSSKLVGLDTFKKTLERDFFSEVNIRNQSSEETSNGLIIELDCNFRLLEILYHLKSGTWGNSIKKSSSTEKSCFSKLLLQLRELNKTHVDVEEFSLILNDTSVIINKIYEQSIPEQLESIFTKVAEHFVYFTKELTEIPFEIYVPVFEESLLKSDTALLNIQTGNNSEKDYFGYWGLYFDSEEDAVIYDLADRSIVYGDLYTLNHLS
ncbi:MAG: hypothetical protein WBG90_19085 [Saonia sp.]